MVLKPNLNVESTFAAAGHQLLLNKHDATAAAAAAAAGFTSNELLFQNLLYTPIVDCLCMVALDFVYCWNNQLRRAVWAKAEQLDFCPRALLCMHRLCLCLCMHRCQLPGASNHQKPCKKLPLIHYWQTAQEVHNMQTRQLVAGFSPKAGHPVF